MEDNIKVIEAKAIFNEFLHLLIDAMPYDFSDTKLLWDFDPDDFYSTVEISLLNDVINITGGTKEGDRITANKVKIHFGDYSADQETMATLALLVQDFQELLNQLAVDFNACQNKFKNAI